MIYSTYKNREKAISKIVVRHQIVIHIQLLTSWFELHVSMKLVMLNLTTSKFSANFWSGLGLEVRLRIDILVSKWLHVLRKWPKIISARRIMMLIFSASFPSFHFFRLSNGRVILWTGVTFENFDLTKNPFQPWRYGFSYEPWEYFNSSKFTIIKYWSGRGQEGGRTCREARRRPIGRQRL